SRAHMMLCLEALISSARWVSIKCAEQRVGVAALLEPSDKARTGLDPAALFRGLNRVNMPRCLLKRAQLDRIPWAFPELKFAGRRADARRSQQGRAAGRIRTHMARAIIVAAAERLLRLEQSVAHDECCCEGEVPS